MTSTATVLEPTGPIKNALDLLAFAREVGTHLEGEWVAAEHEWHGVTLTNDARDQVWLMCATDGSKLTMSWALDDDSVTDTLGHPVGSDSIGASASTGAKKVAAHITRRLLPARVSLRREAYANRDQVVARNERRAQTVTALAEAWGGEDGAAYYGDGSLAAPYGLGVTFPGLTRYQWCDGERDETHAAQAHFAVHEALNRGQDTGEDVVSVTIDNMTRADAVKLSNFLASLREDAR